LLVLLNYVMTVSAQWTTFDSTKVKTGGVQCIGSVYGQDTVFIFSTTNKLLICGYSSQSMLDSSYYAGLGYPREMVQVSKTNGALVYRAYNGFGAPWWVRKMDSVQTTIGSNYGTFSYSDAMMYSTTGVLYYRKKNAKGGKDTLYNSINDGTTFTSVFSSPYGCNLVGMSPDGGVFARVETQVNGGVVTFDMAGTYKSLDEGATWNLVYSYATDSVEEFDNIDCVGSDCFAMGNVLKNNGTDEYDAFFYSSDYGNTWILKSIQNFKELGQHNWGIDESLNVYFGKSNQIYRSIDKGVTFSPFIVGLPSPTQMIYSTWGKIFAGVNSTLYTLSSGGTGWREVSMDEESNIFPNSAVFEIYLRVHEEMLGGEYTIYNSLGQVMQKEKITRRQIIFSIQKFPSGIYFMNMQKKGKQKALKFIKE